MISEPNQSDLLEHYRRIIEISQQLGTTYDHNELLKKIVNAARELIGCEAGSILLLDEVTEQLRFAFSTNMKPYQIEEIIVPLEGSIAGWIVSHGEPRVIQDAASDPNHFSGVDRKISFQTRNLLGVPMRTHTRVIGVIQVVNKHNDQRFTDDDIITLRTLASQAAVAIENARLFQQSDFIAEMVHELRTPLTALKMSTTLLQKPSITDEKRNDIVSTMYFETERLIKLTSDFLDVARLESGRETLDAAPFDMYKLLAESVDVVRPQAADKDITITIEPTDAYAEADRGKIKQVLLNLLTNAIKYNRPGGNITARALSTTDNDYPVLEVSVSDTGYGISQIHQKNMFQKFYRVPTTEKTERGTGLGLTVSKHIVEGHGGRIWLESEEGVGSTFYFTIPRYTEPTN